MSADTSKRGGRKMEYFIRRIWLATKNMERKKRVN